MAIFLTYRIIIYVPLVLTKIIVQNVQILNNNLVLNVLTNFLRYMMGNAYNNVQKEHIITLIVILILIRRKIIVRAIALAVILILIRIKIIVRTVALALI
jgi:hypothetical protein